VGKEISLIAFLDEVVSRNTQHYKSDFELDAQKLRDALDSPNQDERVFYFMSRPNGTWCVLERDAFLRESDGYKIWTHYANMPAGMKRPPIVTLSAGGSFTTPLSSQTPNIQITGATASMWRDRTRKNTPLWRRHSITFRAVLICIVTCFGSCPRRFPMSADGCSASTAIWPPDTYWPLLTNQNQASRQWMTCWPVWTMWIWQSHAPSHLKKAGKSRVNP